jgi:hypothetical protein
MTVRHLTALAAVALALGAALLWSIGWLPAWLGIVVLLASIIVAGRLAVRSYYATGLAVPGGPASTSAIEGMSLPSASDSRFVFSATISWSRLRSGAVTHARPETIAADAILARAIAVTTDFRPEDAMLVEHRLAAWLGAPEPDRSGDLAAWATDVRLSLPEKDERHLASMSELRRREDAWEVQRRLERKIRAYLRDEVLSTPGSAVVWWLARHQDEVEKCVGLVESLSRLSKVASDDPAAIPSLAALPQDDVRTIRETLIESVDVSQRQFMAAELANLLDSFGNADLAAETRRHFGVERISTDAGQ